MLSESNTEGTILEFLPLRGKITDYSVDWYVVMGPKLILTMFFSAFTPYLNFIVGYLAKFIPRLIDSGLTVCSKQRKTKCRTIQQYV
jgi:hypothetical protein